MLAPRTQLNVICIPGNLKYTYLLGFIKWDSGFLLVPKTDKPPAQHFHRFSFFFSNYSFKKKKVFAWQTSTFIVIQYILVIFFVTL